MTTRAEALKQRKDIQGECQKSLVSTILGMCHTGVISGTDQVSVTMHRSQVYRGRYFNMDLIPDTDLCHRMFTKKVLQGVSDDLVSAGYSASLVHGDNLDIKVDLEKPCSQPVDTRGRLVVLTYYSLFAGIVAIVLASKPDPN